MAAFLVLASTRVHGEGVPRAPDLAALEARIDRLENPGQPGWIDEDEVTGLAGAIRLLRQAERFRDQVGATPTSPGSAARVREIGLAGLRLRLARIRFPDPAAAWSHLAEVPGRAGPYPIGEVCRLLGLAPGPEAGSAELLPGGTWILASDAEAPRLRAFEPGRPPETLLVARPPGSLHPRLPWVRARFQVGDRPGFVLDGGSWFPSTGPHGEPGPRPGAWVFLRGEAGWRCLGRVEWPAAIEAPSFEFRSDPGGLVASVGVGGGRDHVRRYRLQDGRLSPEDRTTP